jgi:beta-glucanase (GH16 family)
MTHSQLLFSQEFLGASGDLPESKYWSFERGDGTDYGIPGWGNNELQVYTDQNAHMDGEGHLVIEARAIPEGEGEPTYYGPAQWSSSRMVTKNKIHFKYGRIVVRAKVPAGVGLWPAFWALGDTIDTEKWPLTGEIDIMEWVGKAPLEALGTLHGPGYFGDHGCGNKIVLEAPLSDDFHEFAIDWKPGEIAWFVDGVEYHRATPASVAPNAWVYDHPFYLLLNLAVGGNLGGPLGDDIAEVNQLVVDFIRVYKFEGHGEISSFTN